MKKLKTVSEVVQWRMCIGCGACAFICPKEKVQLFDFHQEGIRPIIEGEPGECGSCSQCVDVCPAVHSDFDLVSLQKDKAEPSKFEKEWGVILGVWEGYASDPEIRFKGSSGGALSAISLYCLEKLSMHGVLHISQDAEDPIRNRTQMSRSRDDLLAAAGSRYSPASVCNGLSLVEAASSCCVIIGKPSEISGVRNATRMRSELARKIGVTLSFFCAETPSTHGTAAFLHKIKVDPDAVEKLRYRGFGWPGHFAPILKGETEPVQKRTYRESWSFLQAFRPWSVQLWPDGSGELADISCGDPWYEEPDGKNPGFSVVIARTELGRSIVRGAIDAGYLQLNPAEPWKVAKSQSGLLVKKGSVWGRRLALKLFGLPVTKFNGLDLWDCWRKLPFKDKIVSVFGTLRRIISRKLYQPLKLDCNDAVAVKPPIMAGTFSVEKGTKQGKPA